MTTFRTIAASLCLLALATPGHAQQERIYRFDADGDFEGWTPCHLDPASWEVSDGHLWITNAGGEICIGDGTWRVDRIQADVFYSADNTGITNMGLGTGGSSRSKYVFADQSGSQLRIQLIKGAGDQTNCFITPRWTDATVVHFDLELVGGVLRATLTEPLTGTYICESMVPDTMEGGIVRLMRSGSSSPQDAYFDNVIISGPDLGLPENEPPVSSCQDVTVVTDPQVCTADATIDAGSFDPDGDPITLSQSPEGPYSLGDTLVTLTVDDGRGAAEHCLATVTVVDEAAPVVVCSASAQSVEEASAPLSASATDNCSVASISVSDIGCIGDDDDCFEEGGVVEWLAAAKDSSGNEIVRQCLLQVGEGDDDDSDDDDDDDD